MSQALCTSHPFYVPQFCVLKYKDYDCDGDDDNDVNNIKVRYGCFVSCVILFQSDIL